MIKIKVKIGCLDYIGYFYGKHLGENLGKNLHSILFLI